MPTVEVISSVFHQSSDASTCEEKKVFFWGNITSQLAHWKATRGPHYYFFAVETIVKEIVAQDECLGLLILQPLYVVGVRIQLDAGWDLHLGVQETHETFL